MTLVLIVAALTSLLSLLFKRDSSAIKIERRDIGVIALAALLIAIIRKGFLIFGLSYTSPIDGSIIFTISPVMVLIISVLMGLERFSIKKTLGVLLGLGGAIGVIVTSASKGGADSGVLGNILVFGCAFITAIYVVWFKKLLSKYDPVVILRMMFYIAAIVITPFGLHSVMEVDFAKFTPHAWLAVGYLCIMPTFLPNLLLTTALTKVAPSTASIYNYVQPTVAVLVSVAMGLDHLHPATILFAVVIFMGVGLVIKR